MELFREREREGLALFRLKKAVLSGMTTKEDQASEEIKNVVMESKKIKECLSVASSMCLSI